MYGDTLYMKVVALAEILLILILKNIIRWIVMREKHRWKVLFSF